MEERKLWDFAEETVRRMDATVQDPISGRIVGFTLPGDTDVIFVNRQIAGMMERILVREGAIPYSAGTVETDSYPFD